MAIETNYIPLSAIRVEAREELLALLWSSGARRYLRIYDYVTVAFLSHRLDLDIGFPCKVPEIRTGSQSQFASFLSQHQTWYEDAQLDGWLGFLDDYSVLGTKQTDKDLFWEFLKSKKSKYHNEDALWQLAAGAERFVTVLSDLYVALSESERPYYGSFYAYWMGRFYGYDSTDKGFKRDKKQTDWSKVVLKSRRLKEYVRSSVEVKEGGGRRSRAQVSRLVQKYWQLLEERNSRCKDFWKVTRTFLNSYIRR